MASAGACPWDDCVWHLDSLKKWYFTCWSKGNGKVPSQSLKWNLKMAPWNRMFFWKPSVLGSIFNLGSVSVETQLGLAPAFLILFW